MDIDSFRVTDRNHWNLDVMSHSQCHAHRGDGKILGEALASQAGVLGDWIDLTTHHAYFIHICSLWRVAA